MADFFDDGREAVCIIPPGASTEQVGDLITLLGSICLGHELFMANQTDGSIAIFYYRDDEERKQRRANTHIIEEPDPNVELEIGFSEEPTPKQLLAAGLITESEAEQLKAQRALKGLDDQKFRYASTEADESILGLVSFMLPVLESYDAANYVTTTILHDGKKFAFTIQRGDGMTPAEKIADLEGKLLEALSA